MAFPARHRSSSLIGVKRRGSPPNNVRFAMHLTLLTLPLAAALLLAAHFFRAGQPVLVAACVLALVLLAVPRPWAARAIQLALVAGAVEWLRTLAAFAAARISLGQPYLRLTAILLAVAALTAAAALVFQHRALKRRYRL